MVRFKTSNPLSPRLFATCIVALASSLIMLKQLDAGDAPDKEANKYVVWVFRLADGKWNKQEDKTLSTNDVDKAWAYANSFLARPDWEQWTTTSNAPLATRPLPEKMSTAMAARLLVGKWTSEPDSFLGTEDQHLCSLMISQDFTARFISPSFIDGNPDYDDEATWSVVDGVLGLVGKEDNWLKTFRIKGTKLVYTIGNEEGGEFVHVSTEPKP